MHFSLKLDMNHFQPTHNVLYELFWELVKSFRLYHKSSLFWPDIIFIIIYLPLFRNSWKRLFESLEAFHASFLSLVTFPLRPDREKNWKLKLRNHLIILIREKCWYYEKRVLEVLRLLKCDSAKLKSDSSPKARSKDPHLKGKTDYYYFLYLNLNLNQLFLEYKLSWVTS